MGESRSLLDSIKDDINKSAGGSFGKFFRVGQDGKNRVRFLKDFNEGVAVVFHDKWQGYNHPCLKQYGKKCPNCGNKEGRTATVYYWPIWNYERKEIQWFGFKANNASPIPGLANLQEELGDITNQDIVIKKNGSGTKTTYSCIPTGKIVSWTKIKAKFKVKDKPETKKQLMQLLYETYTDYGEDLDYDEDYEDDDFDEDYEEEKQKKKEKSKKVTKKKVKPKYEEEEDEEEDLDDDFDEEDDDEDYDDDFEDEDDDGELPWDEVDDDEEDEEEYEPPKKRKKTQSKQTNKTKRK